MKSDNGNNPAVKVVTPEVNRIKASGPILLLALLFVVGSFLAWYFTWFGRELSDADVAKYLSEYDKPRHVQHALLQIQQRIERGDRSAKKWYPEIIKLADNPETEFRLTTAWLMGFDNNATEFHSALLKLVKDQQPVVRRNAALALVRFNDSSGHDEIVNALQPFEVKTSGAGEVASTLKEGSNLARGTLLARIKQTDGSLLDVRSPLPGKVQNVRSPIGTKVTVEQTLLTISPDEDTVWESLRGLSVIGKPEDLSAIEPLARGESGTSDRIKQQAAATVKAINSRKS